MARDPDQTTTTNESSRDSPPREVPATEPELYDEDILLEEETLSWFHPQKWYPVRIGEVLNSRYQVLVKLGFGSVSTVWLCRDLRRHNYVSLKIYENGHRQAENETKVMQHFRSLSERPDGWNLVRRFRASFEIPGPLGAHVCLVGDPLCMTLEDLRLYGNGKLSAELVRPFFHVTLRAVNFLHETAHVVHTDLQAGNIMLSTDDSQIWDDLVEEEWESPSARKISGERVIYESKSPDIPDEGVPVVCDFGEARVGDGPFVGEVMPDLYRAPEIVLCIPWTTKIDIWSLGLLLWDLIEGKHLFNKRLPSREATRGAQLARMVALLGKPPQDFLSRSVISTEFFDEEGNLKVEVDGVEKTSLEEEEEVFSGEEKAKFLSFIKRMLQWRPEDRATAEELLEDPWLKIQEEELEVKDH